MNNKIVTDPAQKQQVGGTNAKNVNTKPNEMGGFNIMSHLKISDPNTKQILVKKRGDD